jgi:hypothetical protein
VRCRSLAFLGAIGLVPAAFFGEACNAKSNLVDKGGECFLATDCQPGLVCIEQANRSRICTDDLSRVGGRPPAEAGGEDMDAEADGQVQEEAGADTGTPDTGADTGPLPQDAGGDG